MPLSEEELHATGETTGVETEEFNPLPLEEVLKKAKPVQVQRPETSAAYMVAVQPPGGEEFVPPTPDALFAPSPVVQSTEPVIAPTGEFQYSFAKEAEKQKQKPIAVEPVITTPASIEVDKAKAAVELFSRSKSGEDVSSLLKEAERTSGVKANLKELLNKDLQSQGVVFDAYTTPIHNIPKKESVKTFMQKVSDINTTYDTDVKQQESSLLKDITAFEKESETLDLTDKAAVDAHNAKVEELTKRQNEYQNMTFGQQSARSNNIYSKFVEAGYLLPVTSDTPAKLTSVLKSSEFLNAMPDEKAVLLSDYFDKNTAEQTGKTKQQFITQYEPYIRPSLAAVLLKKEAVERADSLEEKISALKTKAGALFMPAQGVYGNLSTDEVTQLIDYNSAKAMNDKIMDTPIEGGTIFEGVAHADYFRAVPIIPDLIDALKQSRLKDIAEKANKEADAKKMKDESGSFDVDKLKTLTPAEKELFSVYGGYGTYQQLSNPSTFYKAGTAVPDLASFAISLGVTNALTKGIGKSAGTALFGEVETMSANTVREAIFNMTKLPVWQAAGKKVTSELTDVLVQTAITRPGAILKNTVERLTPETSVFFDAETGKKYAQVREAGVNPLDAFLKAAATELKEVGTERTGFVLDVPLGKFLNKLTAPAKEYMSRLMMNHAVTKGLLDVTKSSFISDARKLFSAGQIHGYAGEIFEEFLGERIQPIIEGKEDVVLAPLAKGEFAEAFKALGRQTQEQMIMMSPFAVLPVGSYTVATARKGISELFKPKEQKTLERLTATIITAPTEQFTAKTSDTKKTIDNLPDGGAKLQMKFMHNRREKFENGEVGNKAGGQTFAQHLTELVSDQRNAEFLIGSLRETKSIDNAKNRVELEDEAFADINDNEVRKSVIDMFNIYDKFVEGKAAKEGSKKAEQFKNYSNFGAFIDEQTKKHSEILDEALQYIENDKAINRTTDAIRADIDELILPNADKQALKTLVSIVEDKQQSIGENVVRPSAKVRAQKLTVNLSETDQMSATLDKTTGKYVFDRPLDKRGSRTIVVNQIAKSIEQHTLENIEAISDVVNNNDALTNYDKQRLNKKIADNVIVKLFKVKDAPNDFRTDEQKQVIINTLERVYKQSYANMKAEDKEAFSNAFTNEIKRQVNNRMKEDDSASNAADVRNFLTSLAKYSDILNVGKLKQLVDKTLTKNVRASLPSVEIEKLSETEKTSAINAMKEVRNRILGTDKITVSKFLVDALLRHFKRIAPGIKVVYGNEYFKNKAKKAGVKYELAVLHATKAHFKKFSSAFMSKGLGDQWHGWGLYFTSSDKVAKTYSDLLKQDRQFFINGNPILRAANDRISDELTADERVTDAIFAIMNEYAADYLEGGELGKDSNRLKFALDRINDNIETMIEIAKDEKMHIEKERAELLKKGQSFGKVDELAHVAQQMQDDIDAFERYRNLGVENIVIKEPSTEIVKTTIHKGKETSEYDYIHWQQSLTDAQLEKIKTFAQHLVDVDGKNPRSGLDEAEIGKKILHRLATLKDGRGEHVYRGLVQDTGDAQDASEFLLHAGIDGIQYFASTGKPVKETPLNYVIFDDSEIAEIEEENRTTLQKSGETIAGAVDNGVVYINSDIATLDTPIHEFSHIFLQLMRQTNASAEMKALYKRGVELMQSDAGVKYMDYVREAYPNLDAEGQIEEALAWALGFKGERLFKESLDKTFVKKLKDWVGSTWGYLTKVFGFKDEQDISSMSLEDFTTKVAGDLLKGELIKHTTSEQLADIVDEVQYQAAKSRKKEIQPASFENFASLVTELKGKEVLSAAAIKKQIPIWVAKAAATIKTQREISNYINNILHVWKDNYIRANVKGAVRAKKSELMTLLNVKRKKKIEEYNSEVDRIVSTVNNVRMSELLLEAKLLMAKAKSRAERSGNIEFAEAMSGLTSVDLNIFDNEKSVEKFIDALKETRNTANIPLLKEYADELMTKSSDIDIEDKDVADEDEAIAEAITEDEDNNAWKREAMLPFVKEMKQQVAQRLKDKPFVDELLSIDESKLDYSDFAKYVTHVIAALNNPLAPIDNETYKFLLHIKTESNVKALNDVRDDYWGRLLSKKASNNWLENLFTLRGNITWATTKAFFSIIDGEKKDYSGEYVKRLWEPLEKAVDAQQVKQIELYKRLKQEEYGLSDTDMGIINIVALLTQKPRFVVTAKNRQSIYDLTGTLFDIGTELNKYSTAKARLAWRQLTELGRESLKKSIIMSLGTKPSDINDETFDENMDTALLVSNVEEDDLIGMKDAIEKKLEMSIEEFIEKVDTFFDASTKQRANEQSVIKRGKDVLADNQRAWLNDARRVFAEIYKGQHTNGKGLGEISEIVDDNKFLAVDDYFPIIRYAQVATDIDNVLADAIGDLQDKTIAGNTFFNVYSDFSINDKFLKGRKAVVMALKMNSGDIAKSRINQQLFYLHNAEHRKFLQSVFNSRLFKGDNAVISPDAKTLILSSLVNHFNRGYTKGKLEVARNPWLKMISTAANITRALAIGKWVRSPAQLATIIDGMRTMTGSPIERVAAVVWSVNNLKKLSKFIEVNMPEVAYRGISDFDLASATTDFTIKGLHQSVKDGTIKHERSYAGELWGKYLKFWDKKALENVTDAQLLALIYFDRMAARITAVANYKNYLDRKGIEFDAKKPDEEGVKHAVQAVRETQSTSNALFKPAVLANVGTGVLPDNAFGELLTRAMWSFKSFTIVDHVRMRKVIDNYVREVKQGNFSETGNVAQEIMYSILGKSLFHSIGHLGNILFIYFVSSNLMSGDGGDDKAKKAIKEMGDWSKIMTRSLLDFASVLESTQFVLSQIASAIESETKGRKLTKQEQGKYTMFKTEDVFGLFYDMAWNPAKHWTEAFKSYKKVGFTDQTIAKFEQASIETLALFGRMIPFGAELLQQARDIDKMTKPHGAGGMGKGFGGSMGKGIGGKF